MYVCAVTSQHGGGHSFYGSNRNKRCSKWPGRSILKMSVGFGFFSSLSKVKIYFFLLFTSNLSYFNSFKLTYKIRLLGFRSPLIITKTLFCRDSHCFCLFGEFAKVFEKQVWYVQVAHLHSAARALSSPSRCFQLPTNLEKDLFGCLLRWDARTTFTSVKRLLISYVSFT